MPPPPPSTEPAYVKSNTVVGDSQHSTGVVLAEIVRANIPVKNGVVHLIHRPLMVVDTTVNQFLEVGLFGILSIATIPLFAATPVFDFEQLLL